MERRGFLKSIFGAGAAVAMAPIAALASVKPEPVKQEPHHVVYGGRGRRVPFEVGDMGRGHAPSYIANMKMPRGY